MLLLNHLVVKKKDNKLKDFTIVRCCLKSFHLGYPDRDFSETVSLFESVLRLDYKRVVAQN